MKETVKKPYGKVSFFGESFSVGGKVVWLKSSIDEGARKEILDVLDRVFQEGRRSQLNDFHVALGLSK